MQKVVFPYTNSGQSKKEIEKKKYISSSIKKEENA